MAEETKTENLEGEKVVGKSRFVGVDDGENKGETKENSKTTFSSSKVVKDFEESKGGDSVRELLEKNLKWSQIIYEQNRKIKRTLTWNAVGSWIKIFIFLVPFILAAVYLWPMLKGAQFGLLDILTDGAILQNSSTTSTPNNAALKSILKVVPMSEEQQKQINILLDNNNKQQ